MTKSDRKITITPLRFVIFSVLTLGTYPAYWAWRAWETVRRSKKQSYRFKSSVRGYFNIISNFSLFPQLKELAEAKGYKSRMDATSVAALYLLVRSLDARFSFTVFCVGLILEGVVLLPMVKMLNYYMEQTKGEYVPDKRNWWLIAVLAIAFAIITLIYLNPNYWKG